MYTIEWVKKKSQRNYYTVESTPFWYKNIWPKFLKSYCRAVFFFYRFGLYDFVHRFLLLSLGACTNTAERVLVHEAQWVGGLPLPLSPKTERYLYLASSAATLLHLAMCVSVSTWNAWTHPSSTTSLLIAVNNTTISKGFFPPFFKFFFY